MPPVISLQRMTTEYLEAEDRIRIIGEVEATETVVLWLTRRLLDRLIPHLALWLERQQGDVLRADLLLSFAHQAAQGELAPQVPVPAWQTSKHWLVQAIDLRPGEEQLQLVFKGGGEGQAVGIGFATTPLRQWLGIVHQSYRAGDWPLDAWPEWMVGEPSSQGASQAVVLH